MPKHRCVHYWRVESPQLGRETCHAICVKCGREAEFNAFLTDMIAKRHPEKGGQHVIEDIDEVIGKSYNRTEEETNGP